MKTKKLSWMLSLVLMACFATPGTVFSQVAPEAYQGEFPFAIGAGASNFNMDWNKARMEGFTVWGQWRPRPSGVLAGLGLDAEVRDIEWGRPGDVPVNLKETTGAGGPMFTIRAFHRLQPYGKFLIGLGSIDFRSPSPYYTHDTRNVYAPGGGFEFRLHRELWVRADYEYQFWPQLFGRTRTLDPQGFTLGFNYDFRPVWH
ncbi:MAG: outer membrane beta-barrel protein [Terracidiphilus sp.]